MVQYYKIRLYFLDQSEKCYFFLYPYIRSKSYLPPLRTVSNRMPQLGIISSSQTTHTRPCSQSLLAAKACLLRVGHRCWCGCRSQELGSGSRNRTGGRWPHASACSDQHYYHHYHYHHHHIIIIIITCSGPEMNSNWTGTKPVLAMVRLRWLDSMNRMLSKMMSVV